MLIDLVLKKIKGDEAFQEISPTDSRWTERKQNNSQLAHNIRTTTLNKGERGKGLKKIVLI